MSRVPRSARPPVADGSRTFICRAILFDLDGVLVDSSESISIVWTEWALRRGLDPARIRALSHGRRAAEVVAEARRWADFDAVTEEAALEWAESHTTRGVNPVPGAEALLAALQDHAWAIVTSGTRAVAMHRIRHVGLPLPPVLVAADDVSRGKPDPEGYLAAAAELGMSADHCIVIEDAAAGVEAARRAGMVSIAVTRARTDEWPVQPDAQTTALIGVSIRVGESGLVVSVTQESSATAAANGIV